MIIHSLLKGEMAMLTLALILFIVLPIAEIAALVKLADLINLGPTLLVIVGTAVLGVFLLRRQGLSSLARAQKAMEAGQLPVEGIYDAAGLLLAGAFLLTPGLITDSAGFALLIPAIRHSLGRFLFGKMAAGSFARFDIFASGAGSGGRRGGERADFEDFFGGEIIEGEAVETEKGAGESNDEERGGRSDRRGDKKSPWRR
jgi:UPF0716 protein FxsA